MLKRCALLFFSACIGMGLLAWFIWSNTAGENNSAQDTSTNSAISTETAHHPDEDALGLALRAMNLTQGEKGMELWRLRAEWANMVESDGNIFMDDPRLTYFMPPHNEELHVTSEKGDVNQKQQIMRFIGKVVATHGNSTVKGELLVYNGTVRAMTFPDGGDFVGEKFSGYAPVVTWRMRDQIIEGSGGVSVTMEATPNMNTLAAKARNSTDATDTPPSAHKSRTE